MNCLKKLIPASACCLCMAVAQFAQADIVGTKFIEKTALVASNVGLQTCNVYVQFDNPADVLLSVGFAIFSTTSGPSVGDPGGCFFHEPFGGDLPPNPAFCGFVPLLCSDSFVTIGVKTANTNLALDPDFSSADFNNTCTHDGVAGAGGGWFAVPAVPPLGTPDANLQVLIAQFTIQAGSEVNGTATAFINDGTGFPITFTCFGSLGCEGDPANCEDDNACTNNICNPDGSCSFPNNSAPCDDGLFCNGADTCGGGSCSLHAGDPCLGGSDCANACNEGADNCFDLAGAACGSNANTDCDNPDTCNGSGVCNINNEPNGMACTSDGNSCTNDVCGAGVCTHPNSPAGTACGSSANTDCDNPDSCNGSGVCNINNEPDGTGCTTDGNGCTNDVCGAGVCTHPNSSAGTPCGSNSNTDCDNPDTCNGSGSCSANNELPGTACGSPANTDCDNPDTCNGSGACSSNNESNGTGCTSDNNDCTNDVCGAGVCTHPNAANGTVCDDGSCGAGESCTCQGGACVSCLTDADCNDGIACTIDDCTAAGCTNTPDDGACDDGDVCTTDTCGAAGCEYGDNDGAACDDGNGCTSGDTCSGGSCGGTPECASDGDCDVANGEVCTPDGCCAAPGVEYALDIREKKCPNKLKCNSNGTIKFYIAGDVGSDVNLIDLDTIAVRACGGSVSVLPDKPPRVKDKVGPHFTECGDCSCAKLKKDYIDDIEIKFKGLCALVDPGLAEGSLVDLEVYGTLLDGTPFTAHDCVIIDRPGSGQP